MKAKGPSNLTAASSGFVKHFFAASRLHHLSTWKADLSDLVQQHIRSNAHRYKRAPITDPFRVIMHVDMDCFFASVAIRDRPHLADKPVAVAHGTNAVHSDAFSSSEIASCNYEARKRGLKNGMFLGQIKAQVPDLVILPYEFDKYDACSKELYRILLENCDFVQAVSCDEVYIDVSYVLKQQMVGVLDGSARNYAVQLEKVAKDFAEGLRQKIRAATGCPASIGISHNLLLARIATTRAKPNGLYFLSSLEAMQVLGPMKVCHFNSHVTL